MARTSIWIAAITGASLLAVADANAQLVGMATSSQGSYGYGAGAAIAKVVTEKSDLNVRVQPFAGSSVYVREINDGAVDFGVANAFETYLAITGGEFFKGRENKNLRVVAVLQPLSVALYVREDSDIKTIPDLKGRNVPGGWTSQASLGPNMRGLLANGGLSYDDVNSVLVANIVANAEDFVAGKIDVMAQAVGSGSVRQVAAQIPLRILPLDDSPKAVEAMRVHMPVAYALTVNPENQPGFSGPTKVMAFAYLVVTSDKVDPERVYKVAKALHGGRKELIAAFRPLAAFSPDRMAQDFGKLGLNYHEGAVKFYKEAGLWPAKVDGLAPE